MRLGTGTFLLRIHTPRKAKISYFYIFGRDSVLRRTFLLLLKLVLLLCQQKICHTFQVGFPCKKFSQLLKSFVARAKSCFVQLYCYLKTFLSEHVYKMYLQIWVEQSACYSVVWQQWKSYLQGDDIC